MGGAGGDDRCRHLGRERPVHHSLHDRHAEDHRQAYTRRCRASPPPSRTLATTQTHTLRCLPKSRPSLPYTRHVLYRRPCDRSGMLPPTCRKAGRASGRARSKHKVRECLHRSRTKRQAGRLAGRPAGLLGALGAAHHRPTCCTCHPALPLPSSQPPSPHALPAPPGAPPPPPPAWPPTARPRLPNLPHTRETSRWNRGSSTFLGGPPGGHLQQCAGTRALVGCRDASKGKPSGCTSMPLALLARHRRHVHARRVHGAGCRGQCAAHRQRSPHRCSAAHPRQRPHQWRCVLWPGWPACRRPPTAGIAPP